MWLVDGGGGEVVVAIHQFMWKYKAGVSVECMFCTEKPTWLCSALLLPL